MHKSCYRIVRLMLCVFFLLSDKGQTNSLLFGQTIQLPTFHTFSLDTAVVVPDQGSTYAGGISRSASSSVTRGPFSSSQAIGRTSSRSGAQVSATIIDLQTLDEELRQQTSPTLRSTARPRLMDTSPTPQDNAKSEAERARSAMNQASAPKRPQPSGELRNWSDRNPIGYEYLATLSHVPQIPPESSTSLEDVSYYLEQARIAKDRGHWSAVEVYYQLAWKNLPADRRRAATDNWNKPKPEPKKPSEKGNSVRSTDR